MIRRSLALFPVLFMMVTGPLAQAAGPTLDLRYRFDKGEVAFSRLELETTSTVESASDRPRRERSVSHTMTLESRVDLVDPERGATITFTLRSLRTRVSDDSQKPVILDSHARRPSDADQVLRELVGSTFTITLNPEGTITGSSNLDVLGRALTSHLDSDGIEAQLALALTEVLTGESLERALAGGLCVLPDHPVGRGDTWSTSLEQPLPLIGSARSTWSHRLARIRKKGDSMLATIESDLRMELETLPSALGGLIELDAEQITGESELIFDATRGAAISATATLELPITVTTPNLDTLENERLRQIIRTRLVHEMIDEREVPPLPE